MANRLQRIMAMDQMMQNRNMPQIGTQNIFDPTSGQFVKVEYQTDPNFKGRRTVMTRTGPQVLPGFQGVENPYRQLGRGVRNLLGNLFDRGSLRREERKREQTIEEASQDPQRAASRERVFDTMLDTMDPSVVQRPEFDPAVTNQARIDELQERINRPILPSQNLPTFDISQMSKEQVKYGDPKTFTLPNGDLAVSRTVTRGNQSGLEIIDPSSGRVIFSNAPGTTSSKTSSATPQANLFAKKMDREVDFEAAAFLSEAEAQKYVDPDITEQEFKRLNAKARLLKARNVENLSFEEKEKVKSKEKRLSDLKTGEISREQNLKKAKEFLKAFEGEEKTLDAFGLSEKADSGADEAAKMMIPGVFSAQGRFNEEFNAFSYTAARAFLKAQGETRPTDADVEGARAALFGVGRDPQTNINLLQDYIEEQEKLLGLTKNKSTEEDFIVRTTDGKIVD